MEPLLLSIPVLRRAAGALLCVTLALAGMHAGAASKAAVIPFGKVTAQEQRQAENKEKQRLQQLNALPALVSLSTNDKLRFASLLEDMTNAEREDLLNTFPSMRRLSTEAIRSLIAQLAQIAPPPEPPVENLPPIATIHYGLSHTEGNYLTYMFGHTSGDDADGYIASRVWEFSGGEVRVGSYGDQYVTFQAPREGTDTYTIKLTVTDNLGATASRTITIDVPPGDYTPPVISNLSISDGDEVNTVYDPYWGHVVPLTFTSSEPLISYLPYAVFGSGTTSDVLGEMDHYTVYLITYGTAEHAYRFYFVDRYENYTEMRVTIRVIWPQE